MQALLEGKKHEFSAYMRSIEKDLQVIAENPGTISALHAFSKAWSELGEGQMESLQKTYIDESPHPIGEKEKLDAGSTGSSYDTVHGKYHPWFRYLLQQHQYYDVFLLDLDGNLIYSVFKELDYATNLLTGEWKNSDLGNAFRAGLKGKAKSMTFFDFRPYAPSHGAPASFMATPIFDNGTRVGVLVYQMPVDAINEVMNSTAGLGETGSTVLVGSDYLLRNDTKVTEANDILKTSIKNDAIAMALAGDDAIALGDDFLNQPAEFVAKPISFAGTNWALVAVKQLDEIYAPVNAMRNQIVLLALGILLILGLVGFVLSRRITNPISALVNQMRDLANGNTDIALQGVDRSDEIGDMNKAVAVFQDNAIERDKLQGDSQRVTETRLERQKRVDSLIQDFRSVVAKSLDGVAANTDQMQSTAQSLTATAEETSSQAGTASTASEAASQNVQAVAAAAEELSASIDEIGRQISDTNDVVGRANSAAELTNEKVTGLADAASRIGKVVSLIRDIAEQTNLLALNATIEAARAGEAGRGFAVVASEVKELATQTGKATEEIGSQISNIQVETESAVAAIGEISEIMRDVNTKTSAIAAAVEEQGASTTEISRNVQQAAMGSATVTDNIGGVTVAAGETAQSIGEILAASENVSRETGELRTVVDDFMENVSAA